jgi:hypothetical protein
LIAPIFIDESGAASAVQIESSKAQAAATRGDENVILSP